MIYLLAVLHAFVDAACAAKLYSSTGELSVMQISSWFLLYNFLAFSTQAIFGGILDILFKKTAGRSHDVSSGTGKRPDLYSAAAFSGIILVAAGAVMPLFLPVSIFLVGMGNSLFHVGGGAYALSISGGKAAGVGVFVGPGSLGLVLGTLFPKMRWIFAAGLVVLGTYALYRAVVHGVLNTAGKGNIAGSLTPSPWIQVMTAIFLCLAVAFRAFGGSFPSYSWKTGTTAILIAAAFVMTGKILGGFVYDRFGVYKTMIASTAAAASAIALFSGNAPASLVGMLALNIAMPVTLILLYRSLSDYPAFAFGLAASVLFPGMILGQITGSALGGAASPTKSGLFICCSLTALILVLVSYMLITRKGKKKEETV
jgi:FSR family fosmidomycin resistance protein-like MFS transporter